MCVQNYGKTQIKSCYEKSDYDKKVFDNHRGILFTYCRQMLTIDKIWVRYNYPFRESKLKEVKKV